jgi:parallel beta-helix repeat protein
VPPILATIPAMTCCLYACVLLAVVAMPAMAQSPAPLTITHSQTLERGKVYGPITIAASDVVLDGNGAEVLGPGASDGKYEGVGVISKGFDNVTLRNLRVRGFATGLQAEHGRGWTVDSCDFSDNFTDPEFGWGEQPDRGGIVWVAMARSAITKTKGNHNWDGLHLRDCTEVTVNECEFSHCSNTCLKLWHTTDSRFADNNFSYGIRIKPGEVHARDSTSVLIESGSDRNHLVRNDCTHGGDGVFVRVLNLWPSIDNVFEGNDASYANNNAFESWSPRNTYLRNKANHSSYGFWLGGSDRTVLIGNEAGWNGDPQGQHNAPLPIGHAGIVFFGGPSSHSLAQDNWCHDNHGGGIVLAGDIDSGGKAWTAFHWVLQGNRIERNRWGIHLQCADWLLLGPNQFADNQEGDVFEAGSVTRLVRRDAQATAKLPPLLKVQPVAALRVGETAVFDASASSDPQSLPLTFAWDLGDGTRVDSSRLEHAYARPGFYRAGVTVDNGSLGALAGLDIYVVDNVDIAADASTWTWTDTSGQCQTVFTDDPEGKLVGAASVRARIDPYDGMRVSLLWPKTKDWKLPFADKKELVFWIKSIDEYVTGWQDGNPLVTLWQSEDCYVRLSPARDFMAQPKNSEARAGWSRYAVTLAGDADWRREAKGAALATVNWITLGFDSWGGPPLTIWIDGLGLR